MSRLRKEKQSCLEDIPSALRFKGFFRIVAACFWTFGAGEVPMLVAVDGAGVPSDGAADEAF